MPNPMKLYNHALAPNPRRVRIFAAEKGIELRLADVDNIGPNLNRCKHRLRFQPVLVSQRARWRDRQGC
jgi:glutathione S-transferase